MRYVFYALAMAAALTVWINSSQRGRDLTRHFYQAPVDPRWSS